MEEFRRTQETRETEEQRRQQFLSTVKGYSWTELKEQEIRTRKTLSVDNKINLMLHFLTTQCIADVGFLTQVSPDPSMEDSVTAIPNIFDSCLILDVLLTYDLQLPAFIFSNVSNLLLRNRDSGRRFNFFLDYNIIPDDIDTNSVATMAFGWCTPDPKMVTNMGKELLREALIYEDGLIDIYLPMEEDSIERHCSLNLLSNWPVEERIDLVTTVNFLLLLNRYNVEHKLDACYRLVGTMLFEMEKCGSKQHFVNHAFAKSYKHVDVLSFFISRLFPASPFAKQALQPKLAKIVRKRLMASGGDPLYRACRILAAFNCELHKDKSIATLMCYETNCLLNSLNQIDFSFKECALYNAHGTFHFGSKAVSTAFCAAAVTVSKRAFDL